MRYLLKNGKLAYSGRQVDIVIDGEELVMVPAGVEVVPRERLSDFCQIDLQERLLMKGFGDLHLHLDKALISEKEENISGTLSEAIEIMKRYKVHMTDEDILERAEKTLLMCYEQGTRFLRTHVDIDANTGIRPVQVMKSLKEKYKNKILMQITAFPQEGIVGKKENYLALDRALAAGADCVGGIPAIEPEPREHIDMIFELARRYNVDVDMHIDETDDEKSDTLSLLAETTTAMGWQGRVVAGHLCSLASKTIQEAQEIMKKVQNAGISIVSLASTNLYLQGRGDSYRIRRGIAPIKWISSNYNIPIVLGSDNIRDPFNPFGNGNMLEAAFIAAHGCHMGGIHDFNKLFEMIGKTPLELLGVEPEPDDGLGNQFIILDAKTPYEAIVTHKKPWGYVENGKLYGG